MQYGTADRQAASEAAGVADTASNPGLQSYLVTHAIQCIGLHRTKRVFAGRCGDAGAACSSERSRLAAVPVPIRVCTGHALITHTF
jgi:hypothetical protein